MVATPDTTTTIPTCAPNATGGVAITQSASDWGELAAFVELVASAATDLSVVGFAFIGQSSEGEFDLGLGAASSEVVKGTSAFWAASGADWSMCLFPIPIHVPSGSRISMRTRKAGTTTTAWTVKLLYYPTVASNCGVVTDGIEVAPHGASAVSVTTSATAWVSSTYGQLSASLTDCVLLGVVIDGPNTTADHWEVDIAKGAALSEVVVTTLTWGQGTNTAQHHMIPFAIPTLVSGTNRISFKARHSIATALACHCKLIYVPLSKLAANPLPQGTTALHGCTPDAANLSTLASNNSGAWANSNYLAMDASTATAQYLTGITIDHPGVTNGEQYEFDVAVGAAASEVVIATIADVTYTLVGMAHTPKFLIPVDAIPASSNVSLKFRKSTTTARTIGFGYTYIRKPV